MPPGGVVDDATPERMGPREEQLEGRDEAI